MGRSCMHQMGRVYTRGASLFWVNRNGQEQPLAAEPRSYTDPRVSPDGSRIALTVRDPDNPDIWVGNVARETLTRLTFDAVLDDAPLWTENGSRIVFRSGREGRRVVLAAGRRHRRRRGCSLTIVD